MNETNPDLLRKIQFHPRPLEPNQAINESYICALPPSVSFSLSIYLPLSLSEREWAASEARQYHQPHAQKKNT